MQPQSTVVASPASAPRAAANIINDGDQRVTFRLQNGMEVLFEQNRAAPVVALQAWVRVGSADEPEELLGVSHFLEHMLFKGTARRGVGQIAREIESAGGEINAWTSYDETVYHVVFASAFFESGADVLSDALFNSSFEPDEIERERQVILEEIKQGLDDPDRVAAQAMMEDTFPRHPYARPVIGTVETVSRMSREEITSFHRARYRAGNITLVVVGDVDHAHARRVLSETFGRIPAGGGARPRATPEARTSFGVRVLARDVNEAQLLLSFRTPSIRHEDIPALDLLAVVLGHGDSSRLHREIVRNRQQAKTAYTYLMALRDGGALVVGATLGAGRVDVAARSILDETLALAHTEIAPRELDKARTILESERVFDRETVQGYARKLGYFATIADDPDYEARYMTRLSALSPTELRATAARYLVPETMSVVAQVPRGTGVRGTDVETAPKDRRLVDRLREVVQGASARVLERTKRVRAETPRDEVVRHVLPAGTRVLILRDTSVPVVALRAMWVGGLRLEDRKTNGITNLIAALLTRGTTTRDAEAIAHEVESMAGSMSGYSGRNSLGVQADFLARHWERGLALVADCLQNATFSDEELEKEKRIVLDDIRAQDDNPAHAVFRLFHETLWTRHPYRMDMNGTLESVPALTRRRLLIHFRRHYPIDKLTLAIVGDVDPSAVLSRLTQFFEPRARGAADRAEPEATLEPREPPIDEPRQAVRFLEREQAHVVVGYPGLTLDHPDRFAAEVLTHVLSGQGGRLFTELRERRGLVYRVNAFSLEAIDPGYLAVYFATSPAHLDEAMAAVRTEIEAIVRTGITEDELQRAQRYLIGVHAIGLQRKGAIAAALAFHEAHGHGYAAYRKVPERVMAVTLSDVARVARTYLVPAHEVVAAIKPQALTPSAAARSAAARSP